MTGLDWLFIILNVSVAAAWIYHRTKGNPSSLFPISYILIYLVHLAMGLYFYSHVLEHGGDALFYWSLPTYFDQDLSTWMSSYMYGTSFIQIINAPMVWAGISFLGGTFIYNLLSFLGIGLIFERAWELVRQGSETSILPLLCALLICMSPGLHLWTGGVSKESLLILSLGLIFYYSGSARFRLLLLSFLGFYLALQVRLITGLVLTVPFVLFVLANHKVSWLSRLFILVPTTFLSIRGLFFMRLLAQVEEISLGTLQRVSEYQLSFLDGFGAGSRIPMKDMSIPSRLASVLFRPFPWEAVNLNSLLYSLENLVLLVLMVCGGCFMIRMKMAPPHLVLIFFAVAVVMVLIFAFTLNNYGIIYRMKSIFLPFLAMPFAWVLCRKLAYTTKLIA